MKDEKDARAGSWEIENFTSVKMPINATAIVAVVILIVFDLLFT
jgi:hypothetical protein